MASTHAIATSTRSTVYSTVTVPRSSLAFRERLPRAEENAISSTSGGHDGSLREILTLCPAFSKTSLVGKMARGYRDDDAAKSPAGDRDLVFQDCSTRVWRLPRGKRATVRAANTGSDDVPNVSSRKRAPDTLSR